MIDGINDTPADAEAMARLLRGQLAHVNLIPMNPVAHTPWQPEPRRPHRGFAATLRAPGLTTTVRRNRGIDIGAACGQLAAEQAGAPAPAAVQRRRSQLRGRAERGRARAEAARDERRRAPSIAASILTADFGNLYRVVRKLERAGVDRLHLDVMDGHFVPNITFGPDVVAAFRRLTRLPLDVHLMIDEPSRFVPALPATPARTRDLPCRGSGDGATKQNAAAHPRRRARQPAWPSPRGRPWPLDALRRPARHRHGHDRRARLRGAAIHAPTRRPRSPRHAPLLGAPEGRGEVHVDGGVNRDTAAVVGAFGADVLRRRLGALPARPRHGRRGRHRASGGLGGRDGRVSRRSGGRRGPGSTATLTAIRPTVRRFPCACSSSASRARP